MNVPDPNRIHSFAFAYAKSSSYVFILIIFSKKSYQIASETKKITWLFIGQAFMPPFSDGLYGPC